MTADEARALITEHRQTQSRLREEMVHVLTNVGDDPSAAHKKARDLFGKVFEIEIQIDQLKQHLPNWGADEPE